MSTLDKIILNDTEYTIGGGGGVGGFRDAAYLFKLKNLNCQGICTDGTYIYFGTGTTVYKYNILTKAETSSTFDSGYYGSNNGMTYNPNDGYIYTATSTSGKGVGVIQASDLTHVQFIDVKDGNNNSLAPTQIAYDRKNNRYILGISANYYIFDSSWNYVSQFSSTHGGTHQDLETDGTYIYKCRSGVSGRGIIAVIDMSGNIIKNIDVTGNELEGLAYDWNGSWYCDTKNSQGLYFTNFIEPYPIETVAQLAKIVKAYS